MALHHHLLQNHMKMYLRKYTREMRNMIVIEEQNITFPAYSTSYEIYVFREMQGTHTTN